MKKIIGVMMVMAALLVAAPAQAQFHFGVKGGLNLSKVSLDLETLDSDNHTGWFIGPMAEFTVPLLGLGVDASALYSQAYLTAGDDKAKLQTIEIPINLKWTFGLGSTAGVFVALGPQFGFNIGEKDILEYTLEDSTTSFNVGAGVKLIQHLQIGVNYNFALKKTGVIEVANQEYKAKNNNWQVSLAYIF